MPTTITGAPGSSPLARGARRRQGPAGPRLRLIPAGAGSTLVVNIRRCFCTAHPRWCGEHRYVPSGKCTMSGSSPLVRGAPARQPTPGAMARLIPAGAGEHRRGTTASSSASGSSPLVRGALVVDLNPLLLAGLIPAGAGSTRRTWVSSRPPGAHPRWCGEHCTVSRAGSRETGSSPLVRGARDLYGRNPKNTRLIPAGAGSTDKE